MSDKLFTSFKLGKIELGNRIVMAPMTRCRSIGNVPGDIVATYYAQRANAGLIIAEGTSPSPDGLGYARIPGLYTAEQVRGWRNVTDAVHDKGGRIFVQLMHTGRIGHPDNLPENGRTLGPSATTAPGEMYTDTKGPQPHPEAIAMTEEDIEAAIKSFVNASSLAVNEAGFDGVELHGANGYLIDQFLNLASNQRTDSWGGNIAGRIKFALEVARRTADAIGSDRVGIRISPFGVFNGMTPDDNMMSLYETLVEKLSDLNLAYLHLVDHSSLGAPQLPEGLRESLRQRFKGAFILSGGYTKERAEQDLKDNKGDLVAFGRPFISNPKLVKKLQDNLPLVEADMNVFYTADEKGYIDYQ